jgi:N-acetylneuraminic acid mutarotase
MKKLSVVILLLAFANTLFAAADADVDPLPDPVSNNAVALLKIHSQTLLFSFMGLGPKKTWDAVTNSAFTLDAKEGRWSAIRPVPGAAGRLGAMAAAARDEVFLFGGFILDARGGAATVPDVGIYHATSDRWFRGMDMPEAVADAVIGVYDGRYIYLVGGRSGPDPVTKVQVYDAQKNKWAEATPIPGTPVFGHAGGLIDDTIVYVDGAQKSSAATGPKYVASDECWMGKIDHHDRTKIHWTKLPNHPGTARYRIAAGGSEKDQKIYFAGGTDNPYAFTGMGFDGKPAEPSPVTFDFNVHTGKWETINENTPNPTMDNRGLLVTPEGLVLIGGMEKGQKVTPRVALLGKEPKTK